MASPWPPARDVDLQAAARVFAEKIEADPESFGIDPESAALLLAASEEFSALLAIARAPGSGTRTSVAAKNMSRRELLKIMRDTGRRVRAHPGTTAQQLRELGMVVPDAIKTPIAAPAAVAAIHITKIDRLAHEIRIGEAASTRRKLPGDCVGYMVLCAVHPRGEKPPLDQRDWRCEGIGTRPTFRIAYRGDDIGKQATIVVRYLNRKGQLGPPSAVASCMVAA